LNPNFKAVRSLFQITKPALPRRVSSWFQSCESVSAFFALFCKLPFAFLGLKQHVVRVAEFFFPALPHFSVPAPFIKLKLVQVFKKFLVKFGLQFKSKTREEPGNF